MLSYMQLQFPFLPRLSFSTPSSDIQTLQASASFCFTKPAAFPRAAETQMDGNLPGQWQ
jgi:hypothetical protein